jgi:hypothetical protein
MNASQIISQYAQKLGFPADAALAEVKKIMDSPDGYILKENDSVFVLQRLDKGVAGIHLFTADDPETLKTSIQSVLQKIKSSGVTKLYGEQENQDLVDAFGQLGVQVGKSDLPDYAWSATI